MKSSLREEVSLRVRTYLTGPTHVLSAAREDTTLQFRQTDRRQIVRTHYQEVSEIRVANAAAAKDPTYILQDCLCCSVVNG